MGRLCQRLPQLGEICRQRAFPTLWVVHVQWYDHSGIKLTSKNVVWNSQLTAELAQLEVRWPRSATERETVQVISGLQRVIFWAASRCEVFLIACGQHFTISYKCYYFDAFNIQICQILIHLSFNPLFNLCQQFLSSICQTFGKHLANVWPEFRQTWPTLIEHFSNLIKIGKMF